jgi:hypothetical protein
MQELGYCHYLLRWRHIVLQPQKNKTIRAFNRYFFLITGENHLTTFTITSGNGHYDPNGRNEEAQHEHTGKIFMRNRVGNYVQIEFIEVIPKI